MGCNCKKQPVVTTPASISEPVLDEISRNDYPDTPEGQHAFELSKWHKEQGENNNEEYPLIHD